MELTDLEMENTYLSKNRPLLTEEIIKIDNELHRYNLNVMNIDLREVIDLMIKSEDYSNNDSKELNNVVKSLKRRK